VVGGRGELGMAQGPFPTKIALKQLNHLKTYLTALKY